MIVSGDICGVPSLSAVFVVIAGVVGAAIGEVAAIMRAVTAKCNKEHELHLPCIKALVDMLSQGSIFFAVSFIDSGG